MRTRARRITSALLPLWAMTATAQSVPPASPGETHAIVSSYVTSSTSSDGSTDSSQGSDTLTERMIARRDGGIERTFDLPHDAPSDARARQWQFPARLFTAPGQPTRLLNAGELKQRLGNWLAAAKLTPADCGRWVFTWNAFRIECDPQSVIASIEAIDLASQPLAEGVAYRTADAAAPLRLERDGAAWHATGAIDPDAVRRKRAEADVVVAELNRTPMTIDEALRTHAADRVSGTISVRFEADARNTPRKRVTKTVVETRYPDGRVEQETATRTVERRPMP